MSERKIILDQNHAMRDGRLPSPTRLEDGEVTFRIPAQDYKVLVRLYPDLESHDAKVKLAAWKKLRNSPVGEQYLVVRTPNQVRRSSRGLIVR